MAAGVAGSEAQAGGSEEVYSHNHRQAKAALRVVRAEQQPCASDDAKLTAAAVHPSRTPSLLVPRAACPQRVWAPLTPTATLHAGGGPGVRASTHGCPPTQLCGCCV